MLAPFCLTMFADSVSINRVPYELKQFRRHDRRALHKENMSRVYTLNGKKVATNRHKATEQTADSWKSFVKIIQMMYANSR